MVYLDGLDKGAISQLALKKVNNGANVSFFIPYTDRTDSKFDNG